MTREEREKAIDALKISVPVMAVTQEEFNDYIQTLNKIMNWLEQEPSISEDGTLTVNVEDGSKVNRVLVCGDNHFGGLYYPEQEPCNDCISRQATLNLAKFDGRDGLGSIIHAFDVEQLPPVTPQYTDTEIQKMQDLEFAEIQKAYEIGKAENPNKWIPVSERLPEEYGEYLITWTTSQSERSFIEICECEVTSEYDYEHNRFEVEWLLEDYVKAYPNAEVIAWMPLPEPYEAESEVQDADSD